MRYENTRAFAEALDHDDPLAGFRGQFNFPRDKQGRSPVYLCGNSLGLQPRLAVKFVQDELKNWKNYAVDGHFNSDRPWLSYHRLATAGFADLTGAKPSEVIAMNTLTVNLHLLMASFYRPTAERRKIVIEAGAFPSDQYAAASQIRIHGHDPASDLLEWKPRDGELHLRIDDLEQLLQREGDSVALLLLPGVQYYTGQVLDMQAICALGRRYGCRVGLDLAHAVGNVELSLNNWAPDFASWCTYKYLNAGPGAVAGAFVHEKHHSCDDFLQGWWGNKESSRFKMRPAFEPAEGAEAWQISNPPILSLAPVIASLQLFREAGFAALRDKSRMLTGFLRWLVAANFGDRLGIITPADAGGCQLSLVVNDKSVDAKAVFDALCELNVTGDWRNPNVIRVAPVPMYNSFTDVFEFGERMSVVLAT
ncbi:MAG: kynureninase [Gammaproteobacteria bacterium]|nr:kynureninase [Gammaproteobacteria bacterium]MDH3363964.1 kynureninase [Gammaproteobacteria bacterium]MDH3480633.1 kynureninase [Gammaproteobacteria bacterium]